MCIQREAVTVAEAAATYPDFTFPLCTAALWHLDCLHFSFFLRAFILILMLEYI